MSTTFGLDVSHYQAGLDLAAAKRQGYEFVMAKCTEGTGYVDASYGAFLQTARGSGMMFAAYHFLSHGNAAAQAAAVAAHIRDKSIPIMLDVEANGATVADANAFRREAAKRGLRVSLLYLPHWYWQRLGSPSLAGWRLVSSAYPSSAHAHGSALYPGSKGSGWDAYGGARPILWQFASTGKIDGYGSNVDLDAFDGSRGQLARLGLFKDYGHAAPAPKPRPKPAPKPGPNVRAAAAKLRKALAYANAHHLTKLAAHIRAEIARVLKLKG